MPTSTRRCVAAAAAVAPVAAAGLAVVVVVGAPRSRAVSNARARVPGHSDLFHARADALHRELLDGSSQPLHSEQRLAVRPVVQARRRSAGHWILTIGPETRELRGRSTDLVLPELLRRLDGTRSVAVVAGETAAALGIEPDLVHGAIARLYDWQIVDDAVGYSPGGSSAGDAPRRAQQNYFALFSSRPASEDLALERARVLLIPGASFATCAAELLARAGVAQVVLAPALFGTRPWDLVVACGLPLASSRLRALNRACVGSGQALLVAALGSSGASLGPLVLAGRSACVECTLEHLYGSCFAARSASPYAAVSGTSFSTPLLARVLAHWVALEVLRHLAPCLRAGTAGRLQTYRPATLELSELAVWKRLRCPDCGALVAASPGVPHPGCGERGDA